MKRIILPILCTGLSVAAAAQDVVTAGVVTVGHFAGAGISAAAAPAPLSADGTTALAWWPEEIIQTATGITTTEAAHEAGIEGGHGRITLGDLPDGETVSVYNAGGALCYRGSARAITLSKGIYIVKTRDKAVKVAVY